MPDILIRDVPEETVAELAQQAHRHRRSREKHALFLIEQGLSHEPAKTCGELLERLEAEPLPDVNDKLLKTFSAQRKRRSNRP
jgi:plasmid stability protein